MGNSSSTATTVRREPTLPEVLTITLSSIRDVKEDSIDPLYSMCIGKWTCQVKKGSYVRYVAVKSSTNNTFPPHFGLLIENSFYLKKIGSTKEYRREYVLAHALIKDSGTMFSISFFNNKRTTFTTLREVHGAYTHATEHESDQVLSVTPMKELVGYIQEELQKPFDQNWRHHLTGAPKTRADVTNCALFSARLLYKVTPNENKSETAENIKEVFDDLGLTKLALQYLTDLNN